MDHQIIGSSPHSLDHLFIRSMDHLIIWSLDWIVTSLSSSSVAPPLNCTFTRYQSYYYVHFLIKTRIKSCQIIFTSRQIKSYRVFFLTLYRAGGSMRFIRVPPYESRVKLTNFLFSWENGAILLSGKGYNTFDPPKIHRFPRNYKSWSNLPNFHKGGLLRTSQSPWKSHFFQTISWGGSWYPKVVNPFVWHQSW